MRRSLLLTALASVIVAACGTPTTDAASGPDTDDVEVTQPAEEETSEPTDTAPPDDTTPGDQDPIDAPTGTDGERTDLDGSRLPAKVTATMDFLADVAARSDEQLLHTLVTESGTSLGFGGETDAASFVEAEAANGTDVYEVIGKLLATTPTLSAGGHAYVFPAVATGADDDGAWEELVTVGLYSSEEVTMLRRAGDGYLGWRLGISPEGALTFLVVGD